LPRLLPDRLPGAQAISTTATKRTGAIDPPTSRSLDLTRRFGLSALANPSILDGVPDGATLVLVPNDDPERAEEEIATGMIALRRDKDVYFRRVRVADLPT